MKLSEKKCKPCEGGVPPLTLEQISVLVKDLHSEWKVKEARSIIRDFRFVNFKQTMHFVTKVAQIAEEEGHHPDFKMGYGYCTIELSTHAINGLSENDFILAAKIDMLSIDEMTLKVE
jgi:4a-hydroxytetrahydrobiopterin dehydratase